MPLVLHLDPAVVRKLLRAKPLLEHRARHPHRAAQRRDVVRAAFADDVGRLILPAGNIEIITWHPPRTLQPADRFIPHCNKAVNRSFRRWTWQAGVYQMGSQEGGRPMLARGRFQETRWLGQELRLRLVAMRVFGSGYRS